MAYGLDLVAHEWTEEQKRRGHKAYGERHPDVYLIVNHPHGDFSLVDASTGEPWLKGLIGLAHGSRPMGLRGRLRRLEEEAKGQVLVVPQRDGTVKRFQPRAGMDAFLNLIGRLGAGEDAPSEHPLIEGARNSSDPKWQESFFAVEDPDEWIKPVPGLSEQRDEEWTMLGGCGASATVVAHALRPRSFRRARGTGVSLFSGRRARRGQRGSLGVAGHGPSVCYHPGGHLFV